MLEFVQQENEVVTKRYVISNAKKELYTALGVVYTSCPDGSLLVHRLGQGLSLTLSEAAALGKLAQDINEEE